MEKYKIEFKRNYIDKKTWIDMEIECESFLSAEKIIRRMMMNDFHARDYDYEYRIVKNGQQIGDIYHLAK